MNNKEKMDKLRKEREKQFRNMALIEENNYFKLVNKLGLVLKNQEVIIDLLSRENKFAP